MNINLTSTTKIVKLNGVPARIWEGKTDSGVPVHAFITRIAVPENEDSEEFEKELQQHEPPSPDIQKYPIDMIL